MARNILIAVAAILAVGGLIFALNRPEPTPEERVEKADKQIAESAREQYKFDDMLHGEYCSNAYIQVLKAGVSGPVAMALGVDSCGFGGDSNETVADAEAEALKRCRSATTGCRIIFSKGAD